MALDEGMYTMIEGDLFNIFDLRREIEEIESTEKKPKKKEKDAIEEIRSYFKKKLPISHAISRDTRKESEKKVNKLGSDLLSKIEADRLTLNLNITSQDAGDNFSMQDNDMCIGKFFALFFYLNPPEMKENGKDKEDGDGEPKSKFNLEQILSDFEEYITYEDDAYKLREKTYLVLFRVGDERKYAYRISTNGKIAIEVEEIGAGHSVPQTLFPPKEYKHIAKSFKNNKEDLEKKGIEINVII